jgi:ATP-binding cassette subfamily F protein 3
MRAKDVLLGVLQEYTGTVVFVSHDRYFIDKLATRVFEIEGGRVKVFPGNYEDYLWRKSAIAGAPQAAEEETPPVDAAPAAPVAEERAKRLNPIRLRQLKDRRELLEEEIARAEAEIRDYESELANFKSADETIRVNDLLVRRRADLDSLVREWEEVSSVIEAAG